MTNGTTRTSDHEDMTASDDALPRTADAADHPMTEGGTRRLRIEKRPGPRTAFAFLPWLLLGIGAFSNVVQGQTSNPWIGGLGLLTFNSLYIFVVFRAFQPSYRDRPGTYVALAGMTAVTLILAAGYGGAWLALFPLLSLACGAVLRGRRLGVTVIVLGCAAVGISVWRDLEGWAAVSNGYGSMLSGTVAAALLMLSEKVLELRETREELARVAVEKERLRFSRDLHDLLGHTLSVIVVKSEAARRLAPHDLDSALTQVHDIETIGRQALNEIREAVTGYREGSLATELDTARDTLSTAGIESVVRQSGPPLAPATAALLGWVVRESVTNVVRHSGATRCELDVMGTSERVRLQVTDNGTGGTSRTWDSSINPGTPGSGLKGLTERLDSAGGTLDSGPCDPHGQNPGFQLTAEIPIRTELPTGPASGSIGEVDSVGSGDSVSSVDAADAGDSVGAAANASVVGAAGAGHPGVGGSDSGARP